MPRKPVNKWAMPGLLVRGSDIADPAKADAIIEQMLDWLEAQGVRFAPERKRSAPRKRTGKSIPRHHQ